MVLRGLTWANKWAFQETRAKEEKQIILKLLGYLVKDGIIRNGLINSLLELDRFKKALKAKHKKQTKQEIKLNKKIKKQE